MDGRRLPARRSRSRFCSTSSRRLAQPATAAISGDRARDRLDRLRPRLPHSCCATSPSTAASPSSPSLIAVWVDDTVAYVAGRAVGRHKFAPAISPGKTWEGFVAGTIGAMFAVVRRALRPEDFLTIRQSIVLGAVVAVARGARRPVRVGAQARHAGEGQRPRARRPRRHARPRRRAPLRAPAAYFTILASATTDAASTGRVRRIALLGATGSIGRQAIEIDRRAARARARRRALGLDADRRPRAAHAGRRRPDRAARARRARRRPERGRRLRRASARRSGRSSAASRSRSRTRRASSPPASSRSRRADAGRRPAAPGRQRALGAAFQCLGRAAGPSRWTRSCSPRPAARSAAGRATSSRT